MFLAVIGTQWGDEGKGKISDFIAQKFDVVVRFQGGNNAGHTICVNNKVYKLKSVPSSILHGKISIIGNGVVVNPWDLRSELAELISQGVEISNENIKIAENCCLILPLHCELDRMCEGQAFQSSKNDYIGTTCRGIGPAYEDKVGRRAIHACDVFSRDVLVEKVKNIAKRHDFLRKEFGLASINQEQLVNDLFEVGKFLRPFVCPVWKIINENDFLKKKILFEGAQGFFLDIDFGTYPFVTSSSVLPGQIFSGCGLSPFVKKVEVLGIFKPYVTRSGAGPFPTELNNDIGARICDIGKEIGVNTNRRRRCGWLDLVMLKQAISVCGIKKLALTKIDVLDSFSEIQVCTSYKIDGQEYDHFPYVIDMQRKIQPVYRNFPGWKQSSSGIKSWQDLPHNLKTFIIEIERFCNVEIVIISTGPERDQTIVRNNFFE